MKDTNKMERKEEAISTEPVLYNSLKPLRISYDQTTSKKEKISVII